jgi:hypothetical protein
MRFQSLSLREGRASDASAMAALRDALRFSVAAGHRPAQTIHGGFLLGCTEAEYRAHASAGRVVVLERHREVAGFAVAFPDAVLRASELWARRDRISWTDGAEPPGYFDARLAYFDQLAVSPGVGARLGAPALAFVCAQRELRDHEHLFATVVERPLLNHAALPLVRRVGGRRVGEVVEEHPSLGDFVSGVYLVSRHDFHGAVARARAGGTPAERAILRFVDAVGAL